MNTVQIQRLLTKDSFAKTISKKVCAKNQLQRVDYPSAYVINSHSSSKPGEHWIAVYFDKHEKGQYFDSYGLPPSVNGFTTFMERGSTKRGSTMIKQCKVCFLPRVVTIKCILFCTVVAVTVCVISFLVSHLT